MSIRTGAILAAAVIIIAGFTGFISYERGVGAMAAEMKALRAEVDSVQAHADALAGRIRAADASRDSIARSVAVHRAADRAAGTRTDSAVAHLRTARDSALAAARDTAATNAELRASLLRYAAASDSAEAAHTRERAALKASIADFEVQHRKDSAAIALRDDHARDLERLNADMRKEVSKLSARMPLTGGSMIRTGAIVAATYATCRFIARCTP